MKKTIILTLLITCGFLVYKVLMQDDVNNNVLASNEKNNFYKNLNESEAVDITNQSKIKTPEEKLVWIDSYGAEGKEIDTRFNDLIASLKPVAPTNQDIKEYFSNEESTSEYLHEFLDNPDIYPREASELAKTCFELRKKGKSFINKIDSMPLEVKNFFTVLKNDCKNIEGERDVFFILEDLAIKGDIVERLLYMESLASAIDRGVINPLLYPIEYMEKRNMGIDWLHYLAAKEVGTAAAKLSFLYRQGKFVEKDYAISYIYAVQAANSDQIINPTYLTNFRNQLTEAEIEKIKRISKGNLP